MEQQKQSIISAQTLVPIGAIGVLVGGVVWLTTIFNTGNVNSAQITLMRADIVSLQTMSSAFSDRLGRIETKLDFLVEQVKSK